MSLLACPFCREMYARGEEATCPECGVDLQPMHALPLSQEARDLEPEPPVHPMDELLPAGFLARGRGALLAIASVGLACFFVPWVTTIRPELATYTGLELAGRAGWLWGGAVGWFILLPLVFTRRTIARLRGVRVVSALFAGLTAAEAVVLVTLTPAGGQYVTRALEWEWGLWVSAALSLVGVLVAARLGGPRIDAPTAPAAPTADASVSRAGETLH
ncbi:MAG: hypothetical protein IT376_19925 [Polyangiaceae bacterium]|nr:hypothetical protein [Polyangiaceae bacterium]